MNALLSLPTDLVNQVLEFCHVANDVKPLLKVLSVLDMTCCNHHLREQLLAVLRHPAFEQVFNVGNELDVKDLTSFLPWIASRRIRITRLDVFDDQLIGDELTTNLQSLLACLAAPSTVNNLRSLHISESVMTPEMLATISTGCPHLRTLDMNASMLTPAAICAAAAALPSLTDLSMKSLRWSVDDMATLLQVRQLQMIRCEAMPGAACDLMICILQHAPSCIYAEVNEGGLQYKREGNMISWYVPYTHYCKPEYMEMINWVGLVAVCPQYQQYRHSVYLYSGCGVDQEMYLSDLQEVAHLLADNIDECIVEIMDEQLNEALQLYLPVHCPQLKRIKVDGYLPISDAMLLQMMHSCPFLEEVEIAESSALTDASTVQLCPRCPNLKELALLTSRSLVTYATLQAMLDHNLHMTRINIVGLTDAADVQATYRQAAEQKGLPLPSFR